MMLGVLTGDIVDSSSLTQRQLDAVMATLRQVKNHLSEWLYPAWATFSRREGDSWQIALTDPRHILRAALLVRATLRRDHGDLMTRIALADGTGTLPDNGDLNAAHGPVFTASGRLLETLDAPVLMNHAGHGATAATAILADHLSQRWTSAQSRALAEALHPDPPPRTEIAAQLSVRRQTVDQALNAAGYPALKAALETFEHRADAP